MDLDEPLGGTPELADQIVQQWFLQARGASVERGWELLYPYVRSDIIGSEARYREAVESVAWETFECSITGVQAIDGEYRVQVRVTGGPARVPPFMTEWGLIQFAPVDGVVGDTGIIVVRIDPAGGSTGIQAVP